MKQYSGECGETTLTEYGPATPPPGLKISLPRGGGPTPNSTEKELPREGQAIYLEQSQAE